ncbi:MAG: DUF4147 domain-containing protein [Nitrosomonas sp.]|nr:DUF4147 domain-containing protein [Nitrosomonas sp.]MDP1949937.1 DUF4147 domain-containing protein [Nitrosomonas sp.]
MSPREMLVNSFKAAVNAANPRYIVPQHLPKPPKGRTLVVGAGKAVAAMALAVEEHWPSDAIFDGMVVTRYGHRLPTQKIEVMVSRTPYP